MTDDRWDAEMPDAELRELLQTHFEAPPFAQDAVGDRLRGSMDGVDAGDSLGRSTRPAPAHGPPFRVPLVASLSAAAAAVLIFVGGAEYGRRTAASSVAGAPRIAVAEPVRSPGENDASASLPIEIQEAGSRYISRLAQLTARRASLTEGDRTIAEDVAWSSLRGAATELARLSENSEALAQVILLLERERDQAMRMRPRGISF